MVQKKHDDWGEYVFSMVPYYVDEILKWIRMYQCSYKWELLKCQVLFWLDFLRTERKL